jgi:hypothetical protein
VVRALIGNSDCASCALPHHPPLTTPTTASAAAVHPAPGAPPRTRRHEPPAVWSLPPALPERPLLPHLQPLHQTGPSSSGALLSIAHISWPWQLSTDFPNILQSYNFNPDVSGVGVNPQCAIPQATSGAGAGQNGGGGSGLGNIANVIACGLSIIFVIFLVAMCSRRKAAVGESLHLYQHVFGRTAGMVADCVLALVRTLTGNTAIEIGADIRLRRPC